MRQRLHVLFSGRVQGVGFRYTVKKLVHGVEVTGTVRNLVDGRVELDAEGEQSELAEFLEAVQSSELGHFIQQSDARWSDPNNEFRGFEII